MKINITGSSVRFSRLKWDPWYDILVYEIGDSLWNYIRGETFIRLQDNVFEEGR